MKLMVLAVAMMETTEGGPASSGNRHSHSLPTSRHKMTSSLGHKAFAKFRESPYWSCSKISALPMEQPLVTDPVSHYTAHHSG